MASQKFLLPLGSTESYVKIRSLGVTFNYPLCFIYNRFRGCLHASRLNKRGFSSCHMAGIGKDFCQTCQPNPTVFAIVYLTYSLKFGILVVSMYWLISKKRSSDVTDNSWLSSLPLLCPHLALWSRLPGLTCNLNKAFRYSHICWFLGVYKFYQIYCKSTVSLSK